MPVPVRERRLPITQSDLSFFDSSSSEDSRRDYEASVKEITDRCGLSSTDYLSSYRSLRQKELKEDDQAISVTDSVSARKITIDVEDFKGGELSIKAIGQNMVVVEGSVERSGGGEGEGGGVEEGATLMHNFRRRFSLPNIVNLDDVTSTLFSDGILTITAPKTINNAGLDVTSQVESIENFRNSLYDEMPPLIPPRVDIVYVNPGSQPETVENIRRSHGNGNSFSETRKITRSFCEEDVEEQSGLLSISEDDTHYKLVLDVRDFKDGDVQVKGIGKNLVVEGQVEKVLDDESVSVETFQRRFSLPTHVRINDIAPVLSSDGILTVLVEKNLMVQEMEH
ncbi:uncharacterized protein LOC143037503 [Oratosquilla oratoria]|uniref:uncharacterized protein LOC143037503 n=1 Tax=Oratosquilla oratoria TaxID=337810 RepID=UPI003F7600A5